jgi:hypothetical protein
VTKQQYERENRLRLAQEREIELNLLAASRENAKPRYVRDVVGFIWKKLVERKVRMEDQLHPRDRARLQVLMQILGPEFVPTYFGA